MNDLLAPVSSSHWYSVPYNNLPNVYMCSDTGNDSSAFNLSFLSLSDLPKYVILISELSSNLVVLTISDWIPSYTSRYFLCSTFGKTLKSNSVISLFFYF